MNCSPDFACDYSHANTTLVTLFTDLISNGLLKPLLTLYYPFTCIYISMYFKVVSQVKAGQPGDLFPCVNIFQLELSVSSSI